MGEKNEFSYKEKVGAIHYQEKREKDAWAEELGSTGWKFPMGSRERCGGGKWVSGRGDCHQSETSEM